MYQWRNGECYGPPLQSQVLSLIFYRLGKYVLGISYALGPLEFRGGGGVRYATTMYIYTLQDALFICYKQFPNNARLIVFPQRANSLRLLEYETLNDYGIINNLIEYIAEREEPDSLRVDKIYAGIELFNKLGKLFLKIDTDSERSMKFSKRASITHIWLS
ncbi:uncharacterized protein TNCV_785331 [Trichonephila clavipes]|nr:uncharacterized protein TNCV_785331 [Trichonephila clavipes]